MGYATLLFFYKFVKFFLYYLIMYLLLFLLFLTIIIYLFKECNYEYFNSNICNTPIFNPDYVNNNYLKNNNCYSYAIMDFKERNKKIQPGYYSNIPKVKKKLKEYKCKNFHKRIIKDNNFSYKIDNNNQKCLCGFHKIALFLDNKKPNLDYHFYREDYDIKNKYTWSHKPGNNTARNTDASNKIIYDPIKSDRDFSKLHKFKHNYDKFCGYYCVKKKN